MTEHPVDVVLVDHRDSYTQNLAHLIAAVTGAVPRVVQHDEVDLVDLRRHSHVVLSPGPGHPADRRDFRVGRDVLLAADRPVFGVCLGMQGLVTTYGGSVVRRTPAHGQVASISHDARGVFAGLPQGLAAVRYHSLGAAEVPQVCEVSATCLDADGSAVVMGVRHRTLPLEGVQFHPESVLSEHGVAMIRNFLDRSTP